MLKIKKKITSPISVIATFALISETSAAISLPFLDNDEREIYIWFLISFPFYLLFLFFITLNFNYRSLYAPSDFHKDENFLKVFEDNASTANTELEDQTNTRVHIVNLPKSQSTLCIIDTRGVDIDSHMNALLEELPQPTKHSLKTLLILTDGVSNFLPIESIAKSLKQGKKCVGASYCIVYNTQLLTPVVLGKN